jgi:hypothetical protein
VKLVLNFANHIGQ